MQCRHGLRNKQNKMKRQLMGKATSLKKLNTSFWINYNFVINCNCCNYYVVVVFNNNNNKHLLLILFISKYIHI